MPASVSTSVKSTLVNWLPWSLLKIWFLAQIYARFSPQQVVHAGGRGCGCARGRYSAGKSSVAQSTAACAAPLLVGGLLGGSQLDRKVLRRWHLHGDEP